MGCFQRRADAITFVGMMVVVLLYVSRKDVHTITIHTISNSPNTSPLHLAPTATTTSPTPYTTQATQAPTTAVAVSPPPLHKWGDRSPSPAATTASPTSFFATITVCNFAIVLDHYNLHTSRVMYSTHPRGESAFTKQRESYCNVDFTFKDDNNTCTNNCQPVGNDYSLVPTATINALFANMPPENLDTLGILQLWSSAVTPNAEPTVKSLANAKFKIEPRPGMGAGNVGAIRVQLQPGAMWGSVSGIDLDKSSECALLVCHTAYPGSVFTQAAFFRHAAYDSGFIAISGLGHSNGALTAQYFNNFTATGEPRKVPPHSDDVGVICGSNRFTVENPAQANETILYECHDPAGSWGCDSSFGDTNSYGLMSNYISTGATTSSYASFYILSGGDGYSKLDFDGVVQSMAKYQNYTWNVSVKLAGLAPSNAPGNTDDGDGASTTTIIIVVVVVVAVVLIGGIALLILKKRPSGGFHLHEADSEMNGAPTQPMYDNEL